MRPRPIACGARAGQRAARPGIGGFVALGERQLLVGFDGQVALITGAGLGIGRAIAVALSEACSAPARSTDKERPAHQPHPTRAKARRQADFPAETARSSRSGRLVAVITVRSYQPDLHQMRSTPLGGRAEPERRQCAPRQGPARSRSVRPASPIDTRFRTPCLSGSRMDVAAC